MYYDDDYEPELVFKKVKLPEGYARAYKLCEGDVFTIKGKDREYTLEYDNNLLYEVVFQADDQSNQYSYNNGQWVQSKWERTGKMFTPEEINNFIK